ncbi:zinc finger and BTB domain-containing protein 24-like [Mercenaria mercenaria]|uniref:zinc finger and BTB domain-containing protein 24-like n=1 Tax=Mercenaria mercenaria TaxID=6596 RepID=UPI00234FB536|nr:zinc finger and BTB domain-containing protein 24-like [Mercenaria mercenaria]
MESNESLQGHFQDCKLVSSILEALNDQRLSSKLCDVILKISDEQIYAHSNVLASASPYFDSLFSGQDLPRAFSQKTPQIIEIHIDGPSDPGYILAVQKVVDFMYTSHIQLDDGVLIQVLEIARIMQMASIIDFCDLYQQGCFSCVIGEPQKLKQTCDTFTQTSDGTVKTGKELIIYRENGTDEKWIFKKDLNSKVIVLNERDGLKRKRGRPRKKPVDDTLFDNKADLGSVTGDQITGERQSENENDKRNNEVPVEESTNELRTKPLQEKPLRVSKHGRIIKPRKFSDDMVSFVKEEPLSDVEIENGKIINGDFVRNIEENADIENIVVKVESEQVKKFACELCEFTTQNMKDFNEHNRDHLHAEKKCSYCGWVSENPDVTDEDFNEHVNNHKGSEMYFCTFCPQRFNTKAKLYQHLPKHSKTKPYGCDICGAGFKWKHALKAHMTVHKDSKDYLCDICGFATAHKTQLKAHHLIHTGNTFKCPEPDCEYQSTKRSNLKLHMMTHSREKPHQCEFCGQSFSLVKNMKRHMLLHTNDRPFRCENCSFSTTRFDKLKEHYFKQHQIGEKPKKKFRLTEYLKMQEMVESMEDGQLKGEQIETDVLNIGEDMETIELQVTEDTNGLATTQIVNVTSSTGEAIPIAITQNGGEISYEIQQFPVQIVTQEIVTE